MNKNVVITGASKGVGLRIAETLLKRGYNIYTFSRNITKEMELLQEKYPNKAYYKSFDFSNCTEIERIFKSNFINYKVPLYGFVNNAAIAYDDLVTNANLEHLINSFNVNVFSPLMLTKYVIRNMIFNNIQGSIVHISSISVHTGYKGLSMYAASKGAIEAFSKNIAREWGPRKIRSNCIIAGFMETEMSSKLNPQQKSKIYARNSIKEPTDISSVASAVSFLLSPESGSITGENIHVDNGAI